MSEMEKLADAIDPRKADIETPDGHSVIIGCTLADLIAASDALRQHATALEIGRGREADIDALCRAMWGEWWFWDADCDNDPPHRQSQICREEQRGEMRAFLANPAVLASLGIKNG